jgi:sugar lactone lactonase YvrE
MGATIAWRRAVTNAMAQTLNGLDQSVKRTRPVRLRHDAPPIAVNAACASMACVTTAEQFTDPVAFHAEGPVWSTSWGGLRYVDMFAGDVLCVGNDGAVTRRNVGKIAAALRPRKNGGAVIAVERGFVLEEPDGQLRTLPPVWDDATVRLNDGGCDPYGRFFCGTMAYDQAPGRGSMYRLDPDGSSSFVFGGVTVSNGLDWSPDGGTAYYNDTPTRRIDAFDYDPEAGFSNRRPFVEIPAGKGSPDGLTVDAEGCVWVALYAGSAVHRYRPDGTLDGVVELPVTQVTACAFGGDDLDTLFITTSREKLPSDAQPRAGAVFSCRPGARGRPVNVFAG